jgi:hypothetical protein
LSCALGDHLIHSALKGIQRLEARIEILAIELVQGIRMKASAADDLGLGKASPGHRIPDFFQLRHIASPTFGKGFIILFRECNIVLSLTLAHHVFT